MEVLNIGIKIQEIIPPTIVTMMVFLMMKVLKYLRVMEDGDIGILITSNINLRNYGVYHSSDGGRCGSRSQYTSHSSSCNCVVYHFGDNGIGGYKSQETSHSSSSNCGEGVDVYGI